MEHIRKLLQDNSKIKLDLGCGENKQNGYVGIDIRKLESVDIVHDIQQVPYPLPDNCCSTILASHIIEHINPSNFGFIKVMNELWRIMAIGGELMIAMPYGLSYGFIQDPTHVNPCNEATFQYFDPKFPLYNIYKPKPWEIKKGFPVWNQTGNMNIVLIKRDE